MIFEENQKKANKLAKEYCYEILKSVSELAPLKGEDIEKAFVAGYASGMVDTVTPEELKAEADKLAAAMTEKADKLLEEMANAMAKIALVDEENLDA